VAADIKAKQYDFNRAQLKTFQTAAGIKPDTIYGNDSWGALAFFLGSSGTAPRALYKPTTPTPYPWATEAGQGAAQPAAAPTIVTPAKPAPQSSAATVSPAPAPASPAPAVAPAPAPTVSTAPPSGPTPPPGFDATKARNMAKQVANNLTSKGPQGYSHDLLKQFQLAAGIAADGLYGGGARGALIYYGVPRPPQPYFKPTETAPYPWASYLGAA
jgi:hypothetical protein